MRKVYVVMGEHLDGDYYQWIAGIWTSYKKAREAQKQLNTNRPENNYRIETEVLF